MSSRFLSLAAVLVLVSGAAGSRDIRVCADPDNLPFSNARSEGFENRIAGLVARDLGARIIYVWGNERRTTALEQLNRGKCDLVAGTLVNVPGAITTDAYMRSAYAFVSRAGDGAVTGFDDPRLRDLTIAVQSVGDEAVTPPVDALLRRGLEANIRPFTLHGNASDPNSAAGIVRAVAAGSVDVAVLWGPFAGYFAAHQKTPLKVHLVDAGPGDPPMRYAIAMGMRKEDATLRQEVAQVLRSRQHDVDAILADYQVPLLPLGAGDAP